MLYIEWVKDKNLFEEINNIQPIRFISEYGYNRIDMIYRVKYGNRNVPKSFENLTVQEVANMVIVSYVDNWVNKYTLMKDEILLGVDSKIVVEESINDGTIRISNSNQENKVSAFNDDELVTNDSDTNTVNDDTQKEVNRNTSTTNTNLNAIKTQLELFNSNFIIDVVVQDVSKLVSLSIY